MTEEKLNLPGTQDLKAIPKDETIDAIVIELEIKTWKEITQNEDKRKNLRNPDGQVLLVKYDADGLIRQDIFPFSEKPTTNSRYGRFLLKYAADNNSNFKPYVGMKIKVLFDEAGNSDIIIKK